MKNLLFKVFAIVMMAFAVVSCSTDDDSTGVSYTIGFESLEGVGMEYWEQIEEVDEIYKTYLSLDTDVVYFVMSGSIAECDAKILLTCSSAEEVVKAQGYGFTFTYVVTNLLTNETTYSYTHNPED